VALSKGNFEVALFIYGSADITPLEYGGIILFFGGAFFSLAILIWVIWKRRKLAVSPKPPVSGMLSPLG